MTFSELGLLPSLITSLAKQGIPEPLPIQIKAIPVLLAKDDAFITAETGSGKTLAYLLPLFCRIDPQLESTQVLVIAPTHELAIQIHRVCTDLAQHAQLPLRSILLLGGTATDRQIEKLKKKPQIAVGSPGRILDLIHKGKLKVKQLRSVVVDEADKLLAGDSLETVREIILAAPQDRQLIFVSATEQAESAQEIATLSPSLLTLRVGLSPVNPNIEHSYIVCEARKKPDILRKLIQATKSDHAVVFVHRNDKAEILTSKLAHHGLQVADLQGAKDKSERKKAMEDFRFGRVRILIASDIAARGLDLPGVTHVFNLDVPTQSKDYLHRVGRTARAGASGSAISLLSETEVRLIRRHGTELGIEIQEVGLREGKIYKAVDRESPWAAKDSFEKLSCPAEKDA